MCYTPEDSIAAFLIGVIGSIFLYSKASKASNALKGWSAIALFYLFVSFMQLFDYLFWITPCGSMTNLVFTKIAMIWNHAQPLVLAYLVWHFLHKRLSPVSQIVLIAYLFAATAYTVYHWSQVRQTCQTPMSGDALEWSWNYKQGAGWMYALFLGTLLTIGYMELKGFAQITFLVWTLFLCVISLYKYKMSRNTGRMWCYFTAFGPILFTIILCFFGTAQTNTRWIVICLEGSRHRTCVRYANSFRCMAGPECFCRVPGDRRWWERRW